MAETVADVVESNMPETYKVLLEHYPDPDDNTKVKFVTERTAQVMEYFWPDGSKTEADLTAGQLNYVGDIVTRLVIPAAKDYYGVRTGRSDSLNPQSPNLATSQRGVGTGRQNYDRLQMLTDLDAMLAQRLARELDNFLLSFGVTTASAGIAISSSKDDLISPDPRFMPYQTPPYRGRAQTRALMDMRWAIDATIWPPFMSLGTRPWWIT